MGKVLNFDKFMAEKKEEFIDVTVYGKTYKVLAQIPALVPVLMARAEVALNQLESTKMLMRAGDALLGRAGIDELCAKGIGATDLATLINQLFLKINGAEDEDEESDSEEITDEASRKASGAKKPAKK